MDLKILLMDVVIYKEMIAAWCPIPRAEERIKIRDDTSRGITSYTLYTVSSVHYDYISREVLVYIR
jgi:hypothetical protein